MSHPLTLWVAARSSRKMAPSSVSEPLWRPSAADTAHDETDSWQHMAKQQVQLAIPLISMNMVQLLLVLSSAAFVGHLGALELASAQLATSLANVTGHYILVRASAVWC